MRDEHHHILDVDNDGENYFLWLYGNRYVVTRIDPVDRQDYIPFAFNWDPWNYDPYPREVRLSIIHAPEPVPEPPKPKRKWSTSMGLRRPK